MYKKILTFDTGLFESYITHYDLINSPDDKTPIGITGNCYRKNNVQNRIFHPFYYTKPLANPHLTLAQKITCDLKNYKFV